MRRHLTNIPSTRLEKNEVEWMDSRNKENILVVNHKIVQNLQFHFRLTKNLHFMRLEDCCFIDFKNAAMQEIINTNAIKIKSYFIWKIENISCLQNNDVN
jgi:hypothetical protein